MPYELWKGKKLNVKDPVFRSKCYILRDRKQLGKFDTRSAEEIFLGYFINNRTYRVYNLHTLTIMESINVVIDDVFVHTDGPFDKNSDSDSATSADVEKEKNKKRDGVII